MAFNLKIDENLPVDIADLLKKAGYMATTVHEQGISGYSDSDIAALCKKERYILVTLDNDFTDIRTYPPERYPGIIVLRLKRQDKPFVLEICKGMIKAFLTETIEGRLWIVEEERIRISE